MYKITHYGQYHDKRKLGNAGLYFLRSLGWFFCNRTHLWYHRLETHRDMIDIAETVNKHGMRIEEVEK